MKCFQKWGGISALYGAAAYLTGMTFFLLLMDYTEVIDPVQKVVHYNDNKSENLKNLSELHLGNRFNEIM